MIKQSQGRRSSKSLQRRFSSTKSLLSLDNTAYSANLSPIEAKKSLTQAHKRWVQQLVKNPDLKVAVIGGGIYGCHFANAFVDACSEASMALVAPITAKLTIFEKDDMLFSQASGKNSFRIHKGFHYPRTGSTRKMCYNDHNKFIERYPNFFRTTFDEERQETIPAFSKVFAVAKGDKTKLDYDAMRDLFKGAKYHKCGESLWDEIDGELWSGEIRKSADANKQREQMEDLGFDPDLIDGAFLVQVEPVLYSNKPGLWFTEKFQESPFVELKMGQPVNRHDIKSRGQRGDILVHGSPFDLVLNCTYNQAVPLQLSHHTAFYDLCISVIVAEKDLDNASPTVSFGIFDGPFPSLEPYDFADDDLSSVGLEEYKGRNLFQIFDVELSSIARSCDPSEAYMLMAAWEEKKKHACEDYQQIVQAIWDKCNKFFPRLESDFELVGTWFALKTKVEDENASRPLIVLPDNTVDEGGRFIQVFSSKLTSIFEAEEAVLDLLDDDKDDGEVGLDIDILNPTNESVTRWTDLNITEQVIVII